MPASAPAICLLTDFGQADPYAAQMKGAILARQPGAAIVDVSHEVPPFALSTAALFLDASRGHFAPGTVFVCVVDPGVGTARRIIALIKDGQTILAPDNGLAGLVLAAPGPARAHDLSAHAEAAGVSATFHGRDVFAPLAAALASGTSPAELGPEVDAQSLKRLPWAAPQWERAARRVRAAVLHVDRFGNAITNLPVDALDTLAAWGDLTLTSSPEADAPATLLAVVRSYAALPPRAAGLLAGSQGRLEIAMNQAHAARALGLEPGRALTLSAGTSGIAEA